MDEEVVDTAPAAVEPAPVAPDVVDPAAVAAAVAPHIGLLNQIEAEFVKLEDATFGALAAHLAALRAEVMPMVEQLKAKFG
jgi:hypothetical protein